MKRILLITYYFPPCGGAAVQRWLRLLPLLHENGYDITVLTTSNGDYLMRDESLIRKIPPEIEVIRTYTPVFSKFWQRIAGKEKSLPYGSLDTKGTTSKIVKLMFWFRLNVIYPDIRVMWNLFAKSKALYLSRVKIFDWVITTGPPHSTHLIGLYLKKHIKIKWLADYRDPWTQINYYTKKNKPNRVIRLLNSHLEKKVVRKADVNLVISQFIANQFPEGNKFVLYNGYDEKQFVNIIYTRGQTFRIKYLGQITDGQDIFGLLRFISSKAQENNINDFQFSLIGTNNVSVSNLGYSIENIAYMPHQQAMDSIVNCELVILLINDYDGNQGMVSTKLFEYIASRTPILCIGPLDGEAAMIINQTKSGFVSEEISESVWDYIEDLYKKWQLSETVRNDHDISQWSVQQQIKELISVLP